MEDLCELHAVKSHPSQGHSNGRHVGEVSERPVSTVLFVNLFSPGLLADLVDASITESSSTYENYEISVGS